MRFHNYSPLSDVSNFLSKNCIRVEYKDINNESVEKDLENQEENMCNFEEIEEVFGDHILMGKRLRKTLYAGNLNDLDDPPDHPPIALTGLAFELFSKAVPNSGLDILDMDYVSCTTEAARISPCAMIVAMIYLERLQIKNSEYLENVSPSGLFVVTMLVASKFLFEDEDDMVTNQMWAEALCFDVKELNSLERDFLAAIDWKVLVDSSEYFDFLCKIEKIIATKQCSIRDWLSYSEICVMLHDAAFQIFWRFYLRKVAKTFVLWTVGYVATALTLHTAGIALNKLLQEKNIKVFENKNVSDELSYVPEVPFHHSLSDLTNSEEPDTYETPDSEVFQEFGKEDNIESNNQIVMNFCNFDPFKNNNLYNSNLSRTILTDKSKTKLYLHDELITNYSYHTNIIHCKPKVKCFSLLM